MSNKNIKKLINDLKKEKINRLELLDSDITTAVTLRLNIEINLLYYLLEKITNGE